MSEAWTSYYNENEIKTIQKILLRSLDVFDDLCKKLSIKYYLYGGSMLGAIKYGGFVPWDDDLDLCLDRSDYEKLLKEGPKLLNDQYELQHPLDCSKSPYHYIKFRKKNTTLVEEINSKIKINHGIYFDIYPIDNIPDNIVDYMNQKIKFDKWIRYFQIRQNYRENKDGFALKFFVKQAVRMVQHLFYCFLPVSFYIKKIDKISTKYNGIATKRRGNLSFPVLLNFYDGNSENITVEFEKKMQQLPAGYEVNIKNRYGDISLMPPVGKRIGHMAFKLEFGEEDED